MKQFEKVKAELDEDDYDNDDYSDEDNDYEEKKHSKTSKRLKKTKSKSFIEYSS